MTENNLVWRVHEENREFARSQDLQELTDIKKEAIYELLKEEIEGMN